VNGLQDDQQGVLPGPSEILTRMAYGVFSDPTLRPKNPSVTDLTGHYTFRKAAKNLLEADLPQFVKEKVFESLATLNPDRAIHLVFTRVDKSDPQNTLWANSSPGPQMRLP
jgi:hypothetical protein